VGILAIKENILAASRNKASKSKAGKPGPMQTKPPRVPGQSSLRLKALSGGDCDHRNSRITQKSQGVKMTKSNGYKIERKHKLYPDDGAVWVTNMQAPPIT